MKLAICSCGIAVNIGILSDLLTGVCALGISYSFFLGLGVIVDNIVERLEIK